MADSQINLSLAGPTTPVVVNQTIDVKLRATQEPLDNFVGQSFVAIDCIIRWDPAKLQLLGVNTTGSVPLLSSYLPLPANDYTGINEASPPADGTALYYGLAPLGGPIAVPLTGVQITTFRFKVKTQFTASTVEILPTLTVAVPADTMVYDGTVPGLDVLGTVAGAVISQVPPCVGDLDQSGAVGGADLATLLTQWGTLGSGDLDQSGLVDGGDVAILLNAWGACPGT